jgi:hypothetical protein
MASRLVSRIAGVVALLLGGIIAWVDTRPRWDDTGVTAGALLVVAGLAALAGVRWWVAAGLVVLPILVIEIRSVGWGIAIAPAVSAIGAVAGAFLRRVVVDDGPGG